jgi:magnesium chelatase accessory protein
VTSETGEARNGGADRPQSHHTQTVRRGRIRWRVQIMGSGPALLLLHGTGASSDSFRELLPLLASRFTVVAPDLPGHASTTVPPWFEPSLPGMAAALDELLLELRLNPTVAVGHSAGAALVAQMTLDGAIEPRLLVGLAAAMVPFHGLARAILPKTARMLAMVSQVLPLRVRNRRSVERMLQSTGSSLDTRGIEMYARLSEQPGHVAGVLAMMANWDLDPLFAELPRLDVPFILVAGSRDYAVPLSQQRTLAARIRRARVVVVEGAGHVLHEEQPVTVAGTIFDALDDM